MTTRLKVTIQDVATQAGVTAMTVSRAINGSARVAPHTRERIQNAINELGYIPNALARGLLTGQTRTIGLLVGDLSNPYWTALASGAEQAARNAGYSLVVGNIASSAAREEELILTMLGNRVDGLLINATSGAPLKRLVASNYPFVLIGPEFRGVRSDVVRGDVHTGAVGLTEHLLSLGHRRIALLNGPPHDFESRERLRGFEETLKHAGLDPKQSKILNGSYEFRGGYDAAVVMLSEPTRLRPTAIVASNNYLALSIIEAARDARLRIPEDLALVCFDDFILAAIIDPFLTVMSQPARTLGIRAGELLFSRLKNPDTWRPTRLVHPPELIIRRSCGAELGGRIADASHGATTRRRTRR